MNKIKILIIMLSVLLLYSCSNNGNVIKANKLLEYHADKYKDLDATGTLENGVRTIHIKSYQFYFEPELIIVNKGEKIKLIVEAIDVPHGFEIEGFDIPDYDIDTRIRPGIPLTLEFEANEKGVWEFICSVYCGFGHSVMKGIFVIR